MQSVAMRRTRTQMAAMLARRERDGLSLRDLAERSGIPVGTLAWWSWRLRQERRQVDDEGNRGFVEVVAAAVQQNASVTVVVGDGLRVEVTAGFDEELLRSVVRALRSC